MLQLRISQTFGQIGIDQTWPVMRMKTPPAEVELSIKPNSFTVSRDDPAVHIDLEGTRASMGYKSPRRFIKDTAQKQQGIVSDAIKKIADEGDRLGRIEAGGNPIPAIAATAAWPQKDFNVTIIPKTPPEISASGGVEITSALGDVAVKSRIKFPEISVQKGNLDVYLKVKPEMKIAVIGQWVDMLG